jgi:hypothetical protein
VAAIMEKEVFAKRRTALMFFGGMLIILPRMR